MPTRMGTEEILARVRAIPAGFVASYGDVWPPAPRAAGRALHDCHDPALPWQRVVRADGTLAKGESQRRLLEAEGVPFRGARVEMDAARVPAEALDELTRRDPREDRVDAEARSSPPRVR